jgi:hypothetical protein
MGLALSGLLAGLGLIFALLGLGLVWAARAKAPQQVTTQQTREPVKV